MQAAQQQVEGMDSSNAVRAEDNLPEIAEAFKAIANIAARGGITALVFGAKWGDADQVVWEGDEEDVRRIEDSIKALRGPGWGEAQVSHEFPAGAYYIGDPCYVLSDEHYGEWLNQIENGNGIYTIAGITFLAAATGMGDFCYDGLDVDSGTLACIPVALVSKIPGAGCIFRRFYEPFTVEVNEDDTFDFAGWLVGTGGAMWRDMVESAQATRAMEVEVNAELDAAIAAA